MAIKVQRKDVVIFYIWWSIEAIGHLRITSFLHSYVSLILEKPRIRWLRTLYLICGPISVEKLEKKNILIR